MWLLGPGLGDLGNGLAHLAEAAALYHEVGDRERGAAIDAMRDAFTLRAQAAT